MAVSASTTFPNKPCNPDRPYWWTQEYTEHMADAFHDLEGSIANARNFALTFELMTEKLIPYRGLTDLFETVTGRRVPEGYKIYALTEDDVDALHFVMNHFVAAVQDVHREFYAAFDSAQAVKERAKCAS